MLTLQKTYSFEVSEIAGGCHSANSRHYRGLAMDVNVINGKHVSPTNPYFMQVVQLCARLGATELLHPGNGPDAPGEYQKLMGDSFCSQIGRTANATYLRGPTLAGWETSTIADRAVDAVTAARGQAAKGEVMPHGGLRHAGKVS
jgi:hypothetical protein